MNWKNQNSNGIVGKTIAEQVADKLRLDIIKNVIPEGSRITVKEIAERYEVGLMPVRDAFQALRSERLLDITPYKNARVLKIDKSFMKNVYDLVCWFEHMLAEEMMLSGNTDVLDDLQKINDQIKKLSYETKVVPEYLKLNYDFHMTIAATSKNDVVFSLYKYYMENVIIPAKQAYFSSSRRIGDIIREHDSIIEAARAGDVEETVRRVVRHSSGARDEFMKNEI